MATKLKTVGIWLAVFLAGFASAIAYMVFIRLHLVAWVEANCLTADAVGMICVVADIFAYNWRVMLIPVVVFALFALFALKLTKKK
jgi:hypothetical protein